MKTMRGAIACVAVATMMGSAPTGAAGQAGAAESAPRIGCFRGRTLDACRSFWILEMQGSVALAQSKRWIEYGDGTTYPMETVGNVLEWNVGHMVNVNDRWALGGILTVGSGNTDPLTGIKMRARRWLHPDLSLELEGGLWRTDANGARWPGGSGATLDLRLNVRDQGSVYVRWDGVDLPEDSFTDFGGDGQADWRLPAGFQQGLSIGASAGSVPGLVGTGALGLAYVILLAVVLSDYN